MLSASFPRWIVTGAAAATLLAFGATSSFAAGDPPKPKPTVDCKLQKNKNKPECKAKLKEDMSDDELYAAGYQLTMSGEHQAALDHFYTAKDQSAPQLLTMIGFATRKLGRVDAAMGYYAKALAADSSLTNTRQYLGEAFLQKGQPDKAREQLWAISQRCGTDCEDYRNLAKAIADFEKTSG
jgi:predicted Zn-dependent protease